MTPEEREAAIEAEGAVIQERIAAEHRYSLSALDAAARYDTPAARRLLNLLEQTQDAAEEVDKERGNCLDFEPPLPGESRGTDYAESLSELALRLRSELSAPTGRGE